MVRTAVILAAGLGSRFGIYTENRPKGFIEVGGISMIERSIRTLLDCNIERIVIGTGYKKEAFEQLGHIYPEIECCYSPRYAETNSMYTLFNLRHLIHENFLLLESDLVYEKRAIEMIVSNEHPNIMLTSPIAKFQDQYYVEFDKNNRLTNCSTDKSKVNTESELVGIHKISKQFFELLVADYAKDVLGKPKLGYEYALLKTSLNSLSMYVLDIPGLLWYEIDDLADLQYAEVNVVSRF